jgi:DNA-nicking Smr family endonuclease
MMRGKVEIEGRLDLHGTGLEESRVRLLQFISSKRGSGARLVLVITGKGDSPFTRHTLHGSSHFHAPERQGRLRRLVPEWLNEREFRAHVAGFQPAHPRHGGGGAFYVRLRRHERSGA